MSEIEVIIVDATEIPSWDLLEKAWTIRGKTCRDCKLPKVGPMLTNAVWIDEVGANMGDVLCTSCITKRLGRPIEPADCMRNIWNISWVLGGRK